MKKWAVVRWVNGEISNCQEFTNRKKSLDFYQRKKNGLNEERKKENKKAKLEDEDEWGYSWVDIENGWEGLNAFKTWGKVKEERAKNEN